MNLEKKRGVFPQNSERHYRERRGESTSEAHRSKNFRPLEPKKEKVKIMGGGEKKEERKRAHPWTRIVPLEQEVSLASAIPGGEDLRLDIHSEGD